MVSLVLTKAQKRRLDGFQNWCLRKIIGVLPSYVSLISNATVLARACYTPATDLLLKRRLQQLGKALRAPVGHPLRTAAFIPNTLVPATERFVKRVGRRCKELVKEAICGTSSFFGSLETALPLAMQKTTWDNALLPKLDF